jgi:hypothetical protein
MTVRESVGSTKRTVAEPRQIGAGRAIMTQRPDEGSTSDVLSFEETYPRYEFSEFVRLSILATEWFGGRLRRRDQTHGFGEGGAAVAWPRPIAVASSAIVLVAVLLFSSQLVAGERVGAALAASTVELRSARYWLAILEPAPEPRAVGSVRHGPPLFFGYVEFDLDPSAPGGVPGFGPLPDVAARESSR